MKQTIIFICIIMFFISGAFAGSGSTSVIGASVYVPSNETVPTTGGGGGIIVTKVLSVSPDKLIFDRPVNPTETIVFENIVITNSDDEKHDISIKYNCEDYDMCMDKFCVPSKREFTLYPDKPETISITCDMPLDLELDSTYGLDVVFINGISTRISLFVETATLSEYNDWKIEQAEKQKDKKNTEVAITASLIASGIVSLYLLLNKGAK